MTGDAHDRPPSEVAPEEFWSPERHMAHIRTQTLVRLAVALALDIERSGMLTDMIGPPPLVFPEVEEAIVRDVVAQLEARRGGRR